MIKGHVTVCASRNVIVLFLLLLIVFSPVMGEDQPATRPLKLALIVTEPEPCLGISKIRMEVVFSNNSDLPVSVYPSSVYDLSFTKTMLSGRRSKVESHEVRKDVGTGDPASHETGVVLQPGVSILVPLEYDASDAFFGDSALYSVRARYMKVKTSITAADAVLGDLESNEALFQITECR